MSCSEASDTLGLLYAKAVVQVGRSLVFSQAVEMAPEIPSPQGPQED